MSCIRTILPPLHHVYNCRVYSIQSRVPRCTQDPVSCTPSHFPYSVHPINISRLPVLLYCVHSDLASVHSPQLICPIQPVTMRSRLLNILHRFPYSTPSIGLNPCPCRNCPRRRYSSAPAAQFSVPLLDPATSIPGENLCLPPSHPPFQSRMCPTSSCPTSPAARRYQLWCAAPAGSSSPTARCPPSAGSGAPPSSTPGSSRGTRSPSSSPTARR